MKSSLSGRTLIIAVIAVLFFGRNISVSAEDWPRWRGVRGNGTWMAPQLPQKWPAAGLPVVWQQKIGGGYGGISVVGERLYVMDRQQSPQEIERVLCLDTVTGETVWQHDYAVEFGKLDYGNGPRSTPTVFEGRVYTFGTRGHLHCLDAIEGNVLWSHDLVAEAGATIPEWGLSASPVIWRNLVIVHPGAEDGCYMAFDRRTGKEVWRSGGDPAGYCTPILIEHSDYEQLVCWSPEHILGMEPSTGRIQWSFPYKITYGVSIATPIFHRGIVFISGYWHGSKAIELGKEPNDAKMLWEENRYLRGLMSQPLARDGYVYHLDKHHGLVCFDIRTGKKIWTDGNRMTPRGRNPQANLVWLSNTDRAIVLNSEGELILARLSPDGYDEQSRTKIIGETWAHPAFAGDFAYARSDTQIVCVRLADQ